MMSTSLFSHILSSSTTIPYRLSHDTNFQLGWLLFYLVCHLPRCSFKSSFSGLWTSCAHLHTVSWISPQVPCHLTVQCSFLGLHHLISLVRGIGFHSEVSHLFLKKTVPLKSLNIFQWQKSFRIRT